MEPLTHEAATRKVSAAAEALTAFAWTAYWRDNTTPIFLAYLPTVPGKVPYAGTVYAAKEGERTGAGEEVLKMRGLVKVGRIPSHLDRAQLYGWIRGHLATAPILPLRASEPVCVSFGNI